MFFKKKIKNEHVLSVEMKKVIQELKRTCGVIGYYTRKGASQNYTGLQVPVARITVGDDVLYITGYNRRGQWSDKGYYGGFNQASQAVILYAKGHNQLIELKGGEILKVSTPCPRIMNQQLFKKILKEK
jgi:hypothetical protein